MIPLGLTYLVGAFLIWTFSTAFGTLFTWTVLRFLVSQEYFDNKTLLYNDDSFSTQIPLIFTNLKEAAYQVFNAVTGAFTPVADKFSDRPLMTTIKIVLVVGIIVFALFAMRNSNRVFSHAHKMYVCTIYPRANDVLLTVNNVLRMTWDFTAGSLISSARLLSIYRYGWAGVLITCGGDNLRQSLNKMTDFLYEASRAYLAWQLSSDERFDCVTPAKAFGEFVSSFYPVLDCLCHSMNPVWKVATGLFSFPSFHQFVDNLVNSVIAIWRVIKAVLVNSLGLDVDEDDNDVNDDIDPSGDANDQNGFNKRAGSDREKTTNNKGDAHSRRKRKDNFDWDSFFNGVSKFVMDSSSFVSSKGKTSDKGYFSRKYSIPTLTTVDKRAYSSSQETTGHNKKSGIPNSGTGTWHDTQQEVPGADSSGRPNTGLFFDSVCLTALRGGEWLDDVVNSTFNGIEMFFGGNKVEPPRISCLASYPICGIMATMEMTLDAVARIDLIVGNDEMARSSFNFSKSQAWWQAWAVCSGSIFLQLDANLSCAVTFLLLSIVSISFGVVNLIKEVAIGFSTGTRVDVILSRLGENTVYFSQATDQWNTFAVCMGDLIGSIFAPAGCIVKWGLLLVSGVVGFMFRIARDGILALSGSGSFSSNFSSSWESGAYEQPFFVISAMGECLGGILDSLYQGAGCFVSRVFSLASNIIKTPFVLVYVITKANSIGKPYADAISEAWEAGSFDAPIADLEGTLVCLANIASRFFEPAGCVIASVAALSAALFRSIFGTINVFVKAAAAVESSSSNDYGKKSASAFLYYYDTGVYGNVYNNMTQLGFCLGEALNYARQGLGCVVSTPVYILNDALAAIVFIIATAIRASMAEDISVFFELLEQAWLKSNPFPGATDEEGGPIYPSGPFGSVLTNLILMCDCLGTLVSDLYSVAGCTVKRWTRFTVLLAWNIIDVAVRTVRSSRKGMKPGELVFQAWYSGLYTSPFEEYEKGVECIVTPLSGLNIAVKNSSYHLLLVPSSILVSVFELVVTVAECISMSLSFPGQAVKKWSEGRFLPPFIHLELFLYWFFQTIAPFQADLAGLMSSLAVVAVRLVYNSSVLIVSALRSVYLDETYTLSITKARFVPVFDLFYQAVSHINTLISMLQRETGDVIGALLVIIVTTVRALFGVGFRAIVSIASLRDPLLDFYTEYTVGTYTYLTYDVNAFASTLGGALQNVSVSLGCSVNTLIRLFYSSSWVTFDLVVRIVYGLRLGIQGTVSGDPLSILVQVTSAFINWHNSGGLEGSTSLNALPGHEGPSKLLRSLGQCAKSLDSLIDPNNGCLIGSTLHFTSSALLSAESFIQIGMTAALGRCESVNGSSSRGCYLGAGGRELEKQWNHGNLSSPLDSLDRFSMCLSTAGLGYIWPSSDNYTCLLPSATHIFTSLLRDTVSFLIVVERSIRLSKDIDKIFYEAFESGTLNHFSRAITLSADCILFVVGKADEQVACTLSSTVRFFSEVLFVVARIVSLIALSVNTGTYFGDNFKEKFNNGSLSGPRIEWTSFCSCLGGTIGSFHTETGVTVTDLCEIPSSLVSDAVSYSVLASDNAKWGTNMGATLKHNWIMGESMETSKTTRKLGMSISALVNIGYPLAGAFVLDLWLFVVDLVGVLFQLSADIYEGAATTSSSSPASIPENLLESWRAGIYMVPFDSFARLALSLGSLATQVDVSVGCILTSTLIFVRGLFLDVTQFLVVLTEAAYQLELAGYGFASSFSAAWYRGEMKNTAVAFKDLGLCIGALVGRASPQAQCIIDSLFSLISVLQTTMVQFIIDVVIAPWVLKEIEPDWEYGSFDFSWTSGGYTPLSEAANRFYNCVGETVSLFDPSLGCFVNWLFQSVQSIFKDTVGFVLAFTRSIKLRTNFGDELEFLMKTGAINSTTSSTEQLARCMATPGVFSSSSSSSGKRDVSEITDLFLCLPSWSILLVVRSLTAFVLLSSEIARSAGGRSMYQIIAEDWEKGRVEPVFQAINGVGGCLGNILGSLSPQLSCFGSVPLKFLSLLLKTVVQMGLDAFDPKSGTGTANTFKKSWESGKYKQMFVAEEDLFRCISEPIGVVDEYLSCSIRLSLNYIVTLFEDIIDLALVIYTSASGSVNFGTVLRSRMESGGINATYTNTVALQPCFAGIGGRYLGNFGCLPASLLLFANSILKTGLVFCADVGEGISSPGKFGTVLLRSWNAGFYHEFYTSIGSVANCLTNLLSEIDPVVACFPTKVLLFASEILETATQMALDIFVTQSFYQSWENGRYDLLWTVEQELIKCFGDAVTLIDERISCPLTITLRYAITIPKDIIDGSLILSHSITSGANVGLELNRGFKRGVMLNSFNNTDSLATCLKEIVYHQDIDFGPLVHSVVRLINSILITTVFVVADFIQGSYGAAYTTVFGQDWQSGRLVDPFEKINLFAVALGGILDRAESRFSCFIENGVIVVSWFLRSIIQAIYDATFQKAFWDSWTNTNAYNPLFDSFSALFQCTADVLGLANEELGCFTKNLLDYSYSLFRDTVDLILCVVRSILRKTYLGQEIREALTAGRIQFTVRNTVDLTQCLSDMEASDTFTSFIACTISNTFRVAGSLLFSVVNLLADLSYGPIQNLPRTFASSWNSGVYLPFFVALDGLGVCLGDAFSLANQTVVAPGTKTMGCLLKNTVRFASGLLRLIVQALLDVTVTQTFDTKWARDSYSEYFQREADLFACVTFAFEPLDPGLGCMVQYILTYLMAVPRDAVDLVLAFKNSVTGRGNFGMQLDNFLAHGRLKNTYNNTINVAGCAQEFMGGVYSPAACIIPSALIVVNELFMGLLLLLAQTFRAADNTVSFANLVVTNWDSGRFDPFFVAVDSLGECLGRLLGSFWADLECIPTTALYAASGLVRAFFQWLVDSFARGDFQGQWKSGTYSVYKERLEGLAACITSYASMLNSPFGCFLKHALYYMPAVASDIVDAYLAFYDGFRPLSSGGGTNLGESFSRALLQGYLKATYNNTRALGDCLDALGSELSEPVGCVMKSLPVFVNEAGMAVVNLMVAITIGIERGGGSNVGDVFSEYWDGGVFDPAFQATNNIGDCLGSLLGMADSRLECITSTLIRFVVEVAWAACQWSFDAFYTKKFAEKWISGDYDRLFNAERAFFRCIGGIIATLQGETGCLITSLLSYLASIPQDIIDAGIAVYTSFYPSIKDVGGVIKDMRSNGRFSASRNVTSEVAGCLNSLGSRFSPGFGCFLSSTYNLVGDLALAFIVLAANLASSFYANDAIGFQQVLRTAWMAGDYEYIYQSAHQTGVCLSQLLQEQLGERESCLGTTSIELLWGVLKSASQAFVDLFLGGDFSSGWKYGAYSIGSGPVRTFAGCVGNQFESFSPGLGCTVSSLIRIVPAVIEDTITVAVAVYDGIKDGGNIGSALNVALDTKNLTRVSEELKSLGECLGELEESLSADLACVTSSLFTLTSEVVRSALRVIASFMESPFANQQVYGIFKAGWDAGYYEPPLASLEAFGGCIGTLLSRYSVEAGCVMSNILPVFTGAFRDLVNGFIAISGSFYSQGVPIAKNLRIFWEQGKLDGTKDAINSLFTCARTGLNSLWDGTGTMLYASAMAFVDLVRGLIWLVLIVGDNVTSISGFGQDLRDQWDAGNFEPFFTDLVLLSEGFLTTMKPASPFLSCLLSAILVDAPAGAMRDIGRFFVLVAWSTSKGFDNFVQNLAGALLEDLEADTDPSGGDVSSNSNSLFKTIRWKITGCLLLTEFRAGMPIPDQFSCVISSFNAFIGSALRGFSIALLSAITTITLNPAVGLCNRWQSGAFDDFFSTWTKLDECIGSLIPDQPVPAASKTVQSVLDLAPALVHDIGEAFCAIAPHSTASEATTGLVSKWDAQPGWPNSFLTTLGAPPGVDQTTGVAKNLMNLVGEYYYPGGYLIAGIFVLVSSIIGFTWDMIVIAIGSAVALPQDIKPENNGDSAGIRYLARLRNGWFNGRLSYPLKSLISLLRVVYLIEAELNPSLACSQSNLVSFFEASIMVVTEVLDVFYQAFVENKPVPGLIVSLWRESFYVNDAGQSIDASINCFGELLALASHHLQCLVTSLLNWARQLVSTGLSLLVVIVDAVASSISVGDAFVASWDENVFNPVFESARRFSACVGGVIDEINQGLGQALESAADALVDFTQGCFQLVSNLVELAATQDQRQFTEKLLNGLDSNEPVFIKAWIDDLRGVAGGIGSFLNIIDPDIAVLVSNIGYFVVESVRGVIRACILISYCVSHGQNPISVFSDAWFNGGGYRGGNFEPTFTALYGIATGLYGIFGWINSGLGKIAEGGLKTLIGAILVLINLTMRILQTISDGSNLLSRLQTDWNNNMFSSLLFDQILETFSGTATLLNYIHPQFGCMVNALVGIAVFFVQFILGIFLFFDRIFVNRYGILSSLSMASNMQNTIASVGYCLRGLVYSFDSSTQCSTWTPTFTPLCAIGDTLYAIIDLMAYMLYYVTVLIPDAVVVGGSRLLNVATIGPILDKIRTVVLAMGRFFVSMIPNINPGSCSTDTWRSRLMRIVEGIVNLVLSPLYMLNNFITSVVRPSMSIGSFLSMMIGLVINPFTEILYGLGQVLDCVSGAGSFFSTVADVFRRLIMIFSTNGINIIVNIIRMVVSLLTGNFNDFISAFLAFLGAFGNIFVRLATQMLDWIIPGGSRIMNAIIDFFTGSGCRFLEKAVNGIISVVNGIIGFIRRFGAKTKKLDKVSICGRKRSFFETEGDDKAERSAALREKLRKQRNVVNKNNSNGNINNNNNGPRQMFTGRTSARVDNRMFARMESEIAKIEEQEQKTYLRRQSEGFSARNEEENNEEDNEDEFDTVITDDGYVKFTDKNGYSFTIPYEIVQHYFNYTFDNYTASIDGHESTAYWLPGGGIDPADLPFPDEDGFLEFINLVVPFDGETPCDVAVRSLSGMAWDEISEYERATVMQCVQQRLFAMQISMAIGWMDMPQDIFYNWMRPFEVTKDIMIGGAIYAQCRVQNKPCATSREALINTLQEMGVGHSAILYIMGVGQAVYNKVLTPELIEAILTSIGTDSPLAALLNDIGRVVAEVSEVLKDSITEDVNDDDDDGNGDEEEKENETGNTKTSENDNQKRQKNKGRNHTGPKKTKKRDLLAEMDRDISAFKDAYFKLIEIGFIDTTELNSGIEKMRREMPTQESLALSATSLAFELARNTTEVITSALHPTNGFIVRAVRESCNNPRRSTPNPFANFTLPEDYSGYLVAPMTTFISVYNYTVNITENTLSSASKYSRVIRETLVDTTIRASSRARSEIQKVSSGLEEAVQRARQKIKQYNNKIDNEKMDAKEKKQQTADHYVDISPIPLQIPTRSFTTNLSHTVDSECSTNNNSRTYTTPETAVRSKNSDMITKAKEVVYSIAETSSKIMSQTSKIGTAIKHHTKNEITMSLDNTADKIIQYTTTALASVNTRLKELEIEIEQIKAHPMGSFNSLQWNKQFFTSVDRQRRRSESEILKEQTQPEEKQSIEIQNNGTGAYIPPPLPQYNDTMATINVILGGLYDSHTKIWDRASINAQKLENEWNVIPKSQDYLNRPYSSAYYYKSIDDVRWDQNPSSPTTTEEEDKERYSSYLHTISTKQSITLSPKALIFHGKNMMKMDTNTSSLMADFIVGTLKNLATTKNKHPATVVMENGISKDDALFVITNTRPIPQKQKTESMSISEPVTGPVQHPYIPSYLHQYQQKDGHDEQDHYQSREEVGVERLQMIADYVRLPRAVDPTTGCVDESICTNCLVADQIISTVIVTLRDTVYYYTAILPGMVEKFSNYEESLTDRRLHNGPLYQVGYDFPAWFFKNLFSAAIAEEEELATDDLNSLGSKNVQYLEERVISEMRERKPRQASSPEENVEETNDNPVTDEVYDFSGEIYEYSTVYIIGSAVNNAIPEIGSFFDSLAEWLKINITLNGSPDTFRDALGKLGEKVFLCNSRNLYTCEDRNMSFGEGLFGTAVVYAAVFFVSIFIPIPKIFILLSIIPSFTFITYNSAPFCVFLPACVVDDLMEFLRDSIFTPCLQWGGLLVPAEFLNNPDAYRTDYPPESTCPSCENGYPTMVSCASDLGYTDFMHNIMFGIRWAFPGFYPHLIDGAPGFMQTFLNSTYFRRYYDRFLMTPTSIPSKDPRIRSYIESLFIEDESEIPTVYKTCFLVSLPNFAPLFLLSWFIQPVMSVTIAISAFIGSIVLAALSFMLLLSTVFYQIRIFVETHGNGSYYTALAEDSDSEEDGYNDDGNNGEKMEFEDDYEADDLNGEYESDDFGKSSGKRSREQENNNRNKNNNNNNNNNGNRDANDSEYDYHNTSDDESGSGEDENTDKEKRSLIASRKKKKNKKNGATRITTITDRTDRISYLPDMMDIFSPVFVNSPGKKNR